MDDFASRQVFKACPLRSPQVRLVRVRSAISEVPTSIVKEASRYDVSGIRKRKLDKNGNSSMEYTDGVSTAASKAFGSSSSAPSISYLMGHQLMVAEVDGQFQYSLPDALGSVRDVVNDSGTVIRFMEFSEYGDLISFLGSGTVSPKTWIDEMYKSIVRGI